MVGQSGVLRKSRQWDSLWFSVAGLFMLINVLVLWIRVYSDFQLPIVWAAIPGVVGLAASVIGLFKLFSRIAPRKPRLARAAAGFAVMAGSSLCIAAIWLMGVGLLYGGVAASPPIGAVAFIGIFMACMVVAFILSAVAFLTDGAYRHVGLLLLVPVVSWGLMLVVAALKGPEVGMSLDLYTNGFIALAFLFVGYILSKNRPDELK